jgi:hypothetical protein
LFGERVPYYPFLPAREPRRYDVTYVAAIGVDNKQYVDAGLPDRLHPSFAVVPPIVLLLQRGPLKIRVA